MRAIVRDERRCDGPKAARPFGVDMIELGSGLAPDPATMAWQDMALDFSALSNAVARLAEGLARYQCDTGDAQIRDGLIQRFEFTYDLSHKMLRRALEEAAANPADIDRMSFAAVVRTGVEQGLIAGDWASWRMFREMRNITSHSYDEAKALQVVAAIPDFLEEARALCDRLHGRSSA